MADSEYGSKYIFLMKATVTAAWVGYWLFSRLRNLTKTASMRHPGKQTEQRSSATDGLAPNELLSEYHSSLRQMKQSGLNSQRGCCFFLK